MIERLGTNPRTPKRHGRVIVGGLAFGLSMLTACGGTNGEVPEVEQTQFDALPDDMRDFRYCEIIPVFRDRATFNVEVYNTQGLNSCPQDLWDQLDKEAMAEEFEAVEVKLNGPRFWVLNEAIEESEVSDPRVVDFGGIEMFLAATIETKLWEGTVGNEFYVESDVQRDTTWVYDAGEMVYDLTSPDGDVYRMQSYSQIIDTDLTIDGLETLGNQLDLPDGWTFEATILEEESRLVTGGVAFVINDELGGSYQKITE